MFRLTLPHSRLNLAGAKLYVQLARPDKRNLWHRMTMDRYDDSRDIFPANKKFDGKKIFDKIMSKSCSRLAGLQSSQGTEHEQTGIGIAGVGVDDDDCVSDYSLTESEIAELQREARERVGNAYLPIALTLLRDEPSLRQVLAHIPHTSKRDTALEFLLTGDVQSVIAVPSTLLPGQEGDFRIIAKLLPAGADRFEAAEVQRVDAWMQHEFSQTVRGAWRKSSSGYSGSSGSSAGGRVHVRNMCSGLNPAWRMRVKTSDRRGAAVNFRICILLSHTAVGTGVKSSSTGPGVENADADEEGVYRCKEEGATTGVGRDVLRLKDLSATTRRDAAGEARGRQAVAQHGPVVDCIHPLASTRIYSAAGWSREFVLLIATLAAEYCSILFQAVFTPSISLIF